MNRENNVLNSSSHSRLLIDVINNQIKGLEATDKEFAIKKILPTDNNNILNSWENIKYLVNALEFLGVFIIPDFYDEMVNAITSAEKQLQNPHLNQLYKDKLLIDCKLYLLHFINLIDLQPKTLNGGEFILDTSDISKFIDSVNHLFPEFKIKLPPQRKSVVIEPKLFTKNTLEPTPSSVIVDSMFSVCVTKNLNYTKNLNELTTKKQFVDGTIDIIFKEISEEILIQFGEDTFAILQCLLSYAFKNKKSLNTPITVSGYDILSYLNKNNTRDSSGDKRISKKERLAWIAHHCNLLSSIDIFIGKWSINKKESITVRQAPLINFEWIDYDIGLDINGNHDISKIKDLHIKYKAGAWFEFFCDNSKKYLDQYGYLHQESLASSNSLAKNIALWLSFKLEQHKSGDFKVDTILEQCANKRFKSVQEEADDAKRKTQEKNLLRDLELALFEEMAKFKDPYIIEYKDPYSWLMNKKEHKPKGWFSLWLNSVVIFKKPLCLNSNQKAEKDLKANKKPLNKIEDSSLVIKEAMTINKVSFRALAEEYNVSIAWIQRRLKGTPKFKPYEVEDLLNKIKKLSKI